jgi:hypothetical protein
MEAVCEREKATCSLTRANADVSTGSAGSLHECVLFLAADA